MTLARVGRLAVRAGLVLGVVAVVYLGVTFVQVWMASRRDAAEPSGAIVVMGAAQYDGRPSPVFQARLDHAVALFEDDIAPLVVVTGGSRPGDRVSEGQAGYSYLVHQGVPEESLRLENAGENSWQSLAAAARFLRGEGVDEVVVVSSPYHALRTEHIAGEVGLQGHASPARASSEDGVEQLGHLGRETLAVGVGRIIGYGRLVRLDDRVAALFP